MTPDLSKVTTYRLYFHSYPQMAKYPYIKTMTVRRGKTRQISTLEAERARLVRFLVRLGYRKDCLVKVGKIQEAEIEALREIERIMAIPRPLLSYSHIVARNFLKANLELLGPIKALSEMKKAMTKNIQEWPQFSSQEKRNIDNYKPKDALKGYPYGRRELNG